MSKIQNLDKTNDIEQAVLKQELMAAKEEIADLRAKIYVSDKEKSGKKHLFFGYIMIFYVMQEALEILKWFFLVTKLYLNTCILLMRVGVNSYN